MSFDYDSSILKDTTLRCYNPESLKSEEQQDEKDASSLNIFQKTLPDAQTNKVKLSEIDVDALVKKYKKNPCDALTELGLEFSDKEKEELKDLLSSKKKLKSFLTLVKENAALKPGDIMSAMRNVKKYTPKSFFKRIGNVVKTAFTEGVSEAIDLAKSETVHYAGKLGNNMNEIRSERTDFTSEAVADVGDTITQKPETKENVMHFVTKDNKDGSKVYTETDVIQARDIIVENIDDAEEFTANAVELEAIQNDTGFVKYKGSTIVDVGEKMIKNKEVKSTIMNVAKKSDMTDEYLVGTTSNLAKNHYMADAIDYMVAAKNHDGKDLFTAKGLYGESGYLVDKNQQCCYSYSENIKEIAKNKCLSGANISAIARDITNHPEIREEVLAKVHSNEMSGNDIEKYSRYCASKAETDTKHSSVKASETQTLNAALKSNIAKTELVVENNENTTNPIAGTDKKSARLRNSTANILNLTQAGLQNDEKTIVQKAVINGECYERSEVLRELRKKYGVSAEKVLNRIEADSNFIEVLKQYNGNKTIIAALVDDPHLISKIKKVSGAISVNELADVVKLCTDSGSTQVMLEALQSSSVQEAIKITKKSKIFNLKDDTMEILASSNSIVNKKNKIEELYLNGGKKKELVG